MFFTFCMCSSIFFKGKPRYFASGICQQKFPSSEGTCPTGFLFLSLSLARSSPLSIAPLVSACPQTGHVFSLPYCPSQFPTSLGPTLPSSSYFSSLSLTNLWSWLTACALIVSIYTYIFPGSSIFI